MIFQDGDRVVMIGDSITDAGRVRPVGECGGLGSGYVSLFNAMLTVASPDTYVRILNTGQSGDTVRDLAARWQSDVLDLKPDVVTIMIGTNDVWRQFDRPMDPLASVDLETYGATLRHLVAQTQPLVRHIVLATPFYIESNLSDAMRARMDEYSAAVREVATESGCLFVDVQAAFDRLLHRRYSAAFAWDRVHPDVAGHYAIAKAFADILL